jgi:hypothetical protein
MNKDKNEGKDKEIQQQEDNANPSVQSNFKKALSIGAQYINSKVSGVLDSTAQMLDLDPNKSIQGIVSDVGMKMYLINKALSTREGQRLMEGLGKFSAEIFKTTEKPLKEGQRIFNEMLNSQLATVEKLAWGALGLVPVIGDVSEVIRVANDLFRSFLKIAKAFAGLTDQGATVVNDMQDKINKGKGIFVDLSKFINKSVNDLNKEVAGVIEKAQKNVDVDVDMESEKSNKKNWKKELMSAKKGGAKCMIRTIKSKDCFLNLGKKYNKTQSRRKTKTKRRR